MSTIDLAYSARVTGGAPLAAPGQTLGDTTQLTRAGGGTAETALAAHDAELARHDAAIAADGSELAGHDAELARHQVAIAAIGRAPDYVNLFRRAHVTPDKYIYLPQGGIGDFANYYLSELMIAAPGDFTVKNTCTWRAVAADGDTELAVANVGGGTTFNAPAGTAWLQISSDRSNLPGQMLVPGDTLPPTFIEPGWEDAATAHRFARQSAARVTDAAASGRSLIILADVTRRAALDLATGGVDPNDDYAVTAIIDVQPGATMTMNDSRLGGWFDADNAFQRTALLPPTFVVPPDASGLVLQLAMSDLGLFRLGPGATVPPRDFERRADRANILDPALIQRDTAVDDAGDSYGQPGWAATGKMRVTSGDFIALSGGTNSLAWHDPSGAGMPSPYHWQATGAIAGGVLTVSAVTQGRILIGSRVSYPGLAATLYIAPGGSGRGGAGTYNLLGYQGAPVADLAGPAAITCPGAYLVEHAFIERPPGAAFAQFQSYVTASLDLATVRLFSYGEVAAGVSPLVGSVAFGADPSTVPFYGQPVAIVGNSQVANGLWQAAFLRATGMALVLNSGNPGKDIGFLADQVIPALAASPGKLCGAVRGVFMEGHNEWATAARALGSIVDSSAVDSTYGVMRKSLEQLLAIDPAVRWTVVGPTYRGAWKDPSSGRAYPPDTSTPGNGAIDPTLPGRATGEMINSAMRDVCRDPEFSVNFSELRRRAGFNASTIALMTSDDLHFSLPLGAPAVGRMIAADVIAGA